MVPPREVLEHVLAEPFQPFQIHTARGRTFEIRHPEMARLGQNTMVVYAPPLDDPSGPERWEKLSFTLFESIAPLAARTGPTNT